MNSWRIFKTEKSGEDVLDAYMGRVVPGGRVADGPHQDLRAVDRRRIADEPDAVDFGEGSMPFQERPLGRERKALVPENLLVQKITFWYQKIILWHQQVSFWYQKTTFWYQKSTFWYQIMTFSHQKVTFWHQKVTFGRPRATF